MPVANTGRWGTLSHPCVFILIAPTFGAKQQVFNKSNAVALLLCINPTNYEP